MQAFLNDYTWGAGIATDLVNTAPDVWRGVDKLPNSIALAQFLHDHHFAPLSSTSHALTSAEVAAVHRLRQKLRWLIDHPHAHLLIQSATEITTSVGAITLMSAGDRTDWCAMPRPDATLADRLALVCGIGILGVVHALGPERFRPCDAPTCSGVFIDTSRPGRRRYCMPERCGNRVNVANHRARRNH